MQSIQRVIHKSYDASVPLHDSILVISSNDTSPPHPSPILIFQGRSLLLLTLLSRPINKPQPLHCKRPFLITQRNLRFPWHFSSFLLFRPLLSYLLNPRFLPINFPLPPQRD